MTEPARSESRLHRRSLLKTGGAGILSVCGAAANAGGTAAASARGGQSQSEPIPVADADDLQGIAADPEADYELKDDITLGGSFTPIESFSGSLDGATHAIQGLEIDAGGTHTGLFAEVVGPGTVENVRLIDADVTGEDSVGALAGRSEGTIRNCAVSGEVFSTSTASAARVGGLVGHNEDGLIEESFSAAAVSLPEGDRAGGLVGQNDDDDETGIVRNSYATGEVSGASDVGGLAGRNSSHIETSFSAASVAGEDDVGGFIGVDSFSTEEDCYWDIETAGIETSPGDAEGLFTDSMQGESVEMDLDFETVWRTVDGSYPELRWVTDLTPAFTVAPTNPDVGESVTFDASATAGVVESYEWGFGDGTTTDGELASHTFETEDVFEVTLTVTNQLGEGFTAIEHVIVGDALEPLPGFENPPQDLNSDGLFEDIDGDGAFTIFDVQAFFNHLESSPIQQNPELFNFNQDDGADISIFDVQALFNRLQNWEA